MTVIATGLAELLSRMPANFFIRVDFAPIHGLTEKEERDEPDTFA
jgi:hypothetical protein